MKRSKEQLIASITKIRETYQRSEQTDDSHHLLRQVLLSRLVELEQELGDYISD